MTATDPATRVDFYVLDSGDARARLYYACRLVEKAYLADQTVYVNVASDAEAAALDDYLWTFGDGSFVPHARAGMGAAPVTIGAGPPPAGTAGVLVNLAPEAPAFFADFERVAEFVDADATRREQGRRRFAFYRENGIRAQTHNVGGDGPRP
jgi:DNA polymerase III subunit chi